MRNTELSRRSFVKTTAYVAPIILTLRARPAHASRGSGQFGAPDKKLRNEVSRFVSDLRKSEHGELSTDVRARMQRTARDWQASGTDEYVKAAVDRTVRDLKKSGNERAANDLKKEVGHLIGLAKKLLGL